MKKIILILVLLPSICSAEIYSWKDKNGNWNFSDKPPVYQAESLEKRGDDTKTPQPKKYNVVDHYIFSLGLCLKYPEFSYERNSCMDSLPEL